MSGMRDTQGFELPFAFDRAEARAVFAPELARLDALIHREVQRLRARYELSLDEFRGLYVSDEQINTLLRAFELPTTDIDVENRIKLATAALGLAEVGAVMSPWEHLRLQLDLARPARDLLLLCFAPELDAKYETLFAYLNNDVTRKWPTPELAARLFGGDAEQNAALRALAQPDAPLMRLGIIEAVPSARDLPRHQRGLRVAPPVADWLFGLPYCDELLQPLVRLLTIQDSPASYREPGEELEHCAERAATGEAVNFVCVATSLEEAFAEAHRLFAFSGRNALACDLAALRLGTPELLISLERAAVLLDLGVVLAPVEALCDPDGRPHDNALGLARRLARRELQMAWIAGTEARWRDLFAGNEFVPHHLLKVAELDCAERTGVWRGVLGGGHDLDVAVLADRFMFGSAGIERVMRHAASRAGLQGCPLSEQLLMESARAVSSEALGGVTRRVKTPYEWSRLVLPQPVKQRLHDVVSAIESRPKVLDEWGFGEKIGHSRGVKVLFAGASGTGKTMAAAIIARTLSLDLHRIELAAVISKYIGETEKNLDRAFETARRTNSILFIDEADALLGKRSEVKDAHDRYANVETAYLLQKMEDSDGVVILATNIPANLDEAFSRRMHFVIDFPMPDVTSREKLWRGMMPARAPIAADVDIPFLARQFVFAGGDIRNVVLDAAYLAVQEGGEIGMRHFLAAVARQFAKRGRLPTAGEFREYFGMLGEGCQTVALEQRRDARERAR